MAEQESDIFHMTVRELLTEVKDLSEVIVDLAYASLMYNSEEMAEKVYGLRDEIEELKYAIRVKTMLASRTKKDAEQMAGVLQVVAAADRISHSAVDIAALLQVPAEKRPFITELIDESDEKIRITRIRAKSDMVGNTIEQLQVEAVTGMKIIALKNRQGWTYDPDHDMKLRAGDDIIVRGTASGFVRLEEFATGLIPWEFPEEGGDDL
ncbi:MAG: potassium transporter TrkA [Thermoplasmatales archaeon]|nr:potassium transporter TrkA [Thermoplasmatales archaeon]